LTAAPVLALALNALLWGLSWWPLQRLQAAGLHPLWATALAYAPALLLLALLARDARTWLRRRPGLWLIALGAGCTNAAFNWAVSIGDVVRVVLLFYLMPLWALLLAWALLRERPRPLALLQVALALAGALTVLWPADGGWPWPRDRADALALAGGFCFAFNNVMIRREAAVPEGVRALAMFGGGVGVAAALALALHPAVALPHAAGGWWPLALLLGAALLCGNLGLQYGAARLPAQTTAVVMLSEVLFATLSSVALGAGSLGPRVLAGGVLIVAAAAWSALRPAHRPGPP
jgi:drug/metabolite transporter (DMT)-like permease